MSRDLKKVFNYSIIKLSLIPLSIWIISTLVFILLRIAPGDPVDAILGINANEAARNILREELGLNESLFNQYLIYINNLFCFCFLPFI